MVGDNANDDNNPQFKVVGTQDHNDGNNSWVNYQSTIQNHTDTEGESASIGFGVDATKSSIGGYLSFVRTGNPSKGSLNFGVYNSGGTAIEDVLTLEAGQVTLNKQTASSIAVFNTSKNLISGTIGPGLSLSSNTLSVDIIGLSTDATPDRNADYVMTYDASATTNKKVQLGNLGNYTAYTTTADKTVSNTTSETSLFASGVGSLTIKANSLVAGKSYLIKLYGYISTASIAPNWEIQTKVGGTTIASTTAVAAHVSLSNRRVEIMTILTCRTTGTSGTIAAQGSFGYNTSGTNSIVREMLNTGLATIDTTADQTLDVTFTWSAANTGNTITITNATIEVMN